MPTGKVGTEAKLTTKLQENAQNTNAKAVATTAAAAETSDKVPGVTTSKRDGDDIDLIDLKAAPIRVI